MTQPHNFKSGLMTIRDAEKLNELQKWIDNRRAALAIPANAFPPSYKFQAKITAYSSDDYTWTRQAFDVDGEYIDDPVPYSGGPSDMPAKERNGKVAVDFPFYAELTFRVNVQGSPYYEFDYTVVDRITIKEVDGSPSVLAKTLELPSSAMSNPSAGVARLLEASSTTGGTVTLTTQTMGAGLKTFGPVNNTTAAPLGADFGTFAQLYQYGDPLELPFSTGAWLSADHYGLAADISFLDAAFNDSLNVPIIYSTDVVSSAISGFDKQYQSSTTRAPTFWIWDSNADACYGVIDNTGTPIRGVTGTIGPNASARGGLVNGLGSGTSVVAETADITGSFTLSGDISPAQLTANTDNWNPTGWN